MSFHAVAAGAGLSLHSKKGQNMREFCREESGPVL